MIILCPFCGNKLANKVQDGITTCDNCQRIIISSSKNRVLSAAWTVRNWHIDLETLQRQCNLAENELDLVKKWVYEDQLNHEEFMRVLEDWKLQA